MKYDEIYLHEHAMILVLEAGLVRWFERYNTWRPHQALGNRTPQEVYQTQPTPAFMRKNSTCVLREVGDFSIIIADYRGDFALLAAIVQ